ncbi:DNA cytosine methyltransferase [bacterium]|jgi:DNA (cytosine-5)-methyltransferase 1|nr:DNA cytosine methyltransferase [bacterium]
MLFKSISKILKTDKKYYIEKINIINELVKKYCAKHDIDFDNIEINLTVVIKELIKIGIIASSDELELLKKTITKEYEPLLKSLTFYNGNNLKFLNKFYNSYRNKQQSKNEALDKPKIIDLFCGAGGFSLGFIGEGYKVELANDIEKVALETYRFNHPEIKANKVIEGDIKQIVENINDYIDTDIDVIIGGPPCQSFSSANQQRVIDDPRNILYKYYVKAVDKIRPKLILMENVRGMNKVASQVVEDFNKIGYDVEYSLFDSSDFSVAQKRVRLLYIGVNRDYAVSKNITPSMIMNEVKKELDNKPRFILKDAIEHIEPLGCAKIKNLTEIDCEDSGKKIAINNYPLNKYLKLINNNINPEFVFNHKARFNNVNDQEIYSILSQGRDATCDSISHIMPYAHRNHVFKDKYFKLIENNPSRTITAHMKMDCHSHIHPTQIRSLTPREAARIQSFPDNYIFLGPYLKTYMQIGNAVPPLMSKVFAKVYKKFL